MQKTSILAQILGGGKKASVLDPPAGVPTPPRTPPLYVYVYYTIRIRILYNTYTIQYVYIYYLYTIRYCLITFHTPRVGGLREALETLVSERSVFFRAVGRSQGGGFQGGGILIGIAAPPELDRTMADYGKRWRR